MGRRFLASFTRSLSFTRRCSSSAATCATTSTAAAAPNPPQETTTPSSSKFETGLSDRLLHLSGLSGSSPHLNWLSDALAVLLSSATSAAAAAPSADETLDASLPFLIDASRSLSRASLSLLHHLSLLDSALLRSLSLPPSAASRRLSAASAQKSLQVSSSWQPDLDHAAHCLLLLRKHLKQQRPKSAHHTSSSDLRGAIVSSALLLGAVTATLSRIASAVADPSSGKSKSPAAQHRRLLAALDGHIGGAAWGSALRQLQRELLAAASAAHSEEEEAGGLARLHAKMGVTAAKLGKGMTNGAVEIGNLRKEVEEMRATMAGVHAKCSGVSRALADLRVSLLESAAAAGGAAASS